MHKHMYIYLYIKVYIYACIHIYINVHMGPGSDGGVRRTRMSRPSWRRLHPCPLKGYKGALLMRNTPPVGPHSRTMPRNLGGS